MRAPGFDLETKLSFHSLHLVVSGGSSECYYPTLWGQESVGIDRKHDTLEPVMMSGIVYHMLKSHSQWAKMCAEQFTNIYSLFLP